MQWPLRPCIMTALEWSIHFLVLLNCCSASELRINFTFSLQMMEKAREEAAKAAKEAAMADSVGQNVTAEDSVTTR